MAKTLQYAFDVHGQSNSHDDIGGAIQPGHGMRSVLRAALAPPAAPARPVALAAVAGSAPFPSIGLPLNTTQRTSTTSSASGRSDGLVGSSIILLVLACILL